MANKGILGLDGKQMEGHSVPKVKGVHPFGSKILVEVLKPDEALGTNLHISEDAAQDAPQAYIVELGPQVPEGCGLKVNQRVFWTGKGTAVNDPRAKNGRTRALMEIHNIIGIVEE